MKLRLFVLFVFGIICISSTSWAGLILDVGVRETYEDNINGSPSSSDKEGDFYTILSASAGGYTEVAVDTYLFLRGDAAKFLYSEYDDLDFFIGGVSTGVYKGLGDVLSVQLTLKSKIKDFKEKPRDSMAYGGTFEIKQQITPRFWIKQGYEYEKNNADSELFDYNGHSVGLWSGYLIAPNAMINIGYSYFTRKYDDASDFRSKSHTVSTGIVVKLQKNIYLNAGYDRQFNDSNVSDTDYTNNIYTMGLIYSF